MFAIVVDGSPAHPDHLKPIAYHQESRVLIYTDTQYLRMLRHYSRQLLFTLSLTEVRVDRDVLQKSEAALVDRVREEPGPELLAR